VGAVLAAGTLAVMAVAVPAEAGAAPKPTVSSFGASPLTVLATGGTVTLSADVTNATSCTFSSNKAVAGLPVSVACSNGPVAEDVTLPVNAAKKAAKYKLILAVTGAKTVKATVLTWVAAPSCSDIGPGADLEACTLAGADLAGADLAGAVLSGADLAGADLAGADLAGAGLADANLSGATLDDAVLSDANLKSARLTDTDLAGAELSDANLMAAKLTGTDLVNADLTGAYLADAAFVNVDLTGVVWATTTCPDSTLSNHDGGTCANNLGF
jgi:hypothetical protein